MTGPRPAVVLCSGLASDRLDLNALRRALSARSPGLAVAVIDHLCDHPVTAVSALRSIGARRMVVGVCSRRIVTADLRERARRSGCGPFDISVVRVPRTRGVDAAAATLTAAVARLAATPPGEPSRAAPADGSLSRRALLRVAPAVGRQPVAAIDTARCAGTARCNVCAAACPDAAILAVGGVAAVRPADCSACGLCVPACPTGAIRLAGAAATHVERQLEALLAGGETAVLFACPRALDALPGEQMLDGWALVEVPALSIVTPGWIAETLRAGATEVRLAPCAGPCCTPWHEAGGAHDLCRRLLAGSDLAASVGLWAGASPGGRGVVEGPAAPPRLTEPEATGAGLRGLGISAAVPHDASPFGLVDVGAGCTTCGACALACPVGALEIAEDDGTIALRHDPARCTGCGLCSPACPEQVVRVHRGVDTARLAGGPLVLARTAGRSCRRCRGPLPAPVISARHRSLLAGQLPFLADADPELCVACAYAERSGPPARPREGR